MAAERKENKLRAAHNYVLAWRQKFSVRQNGITITVSITSFITVIIIIINITIITTTVIIVLTVILSTLADVSLENKTI